MVKKIIIVFAFFLLLPTPALAADLSLKKEDIIFSIPKPLAGDVIRIYATATNTSQQDARGKVRFFVDNSQIGDQPVSALAYNDDAVFVDWAPNEGYYQIKVDIVDIEPSDANTDDNSIIISDFIVDLDTDKDGKYDSDDWDDDNDGVDDGVERINGTNPLIADTDGDVADDGVDKFPLDPKEKYDNDGDGIGNNADPDNDNDGVPNGDDPAPFDPNITGKESVQPEQVLPQEQSAPKEDENDENKEAKQEQTAPKEDSSKPEYKIEEVSYTFPDKSEAKYVLDVMIAKSRKSWNTFKFDVLGAHEDGGFMFLWDFGDGKVGQTSAVEHKFKGSGEYKVSLSVSDSKGGLGTSEEIITIGFWNIGNPWILFFVSILGVSCLALLGYIIFQAVLQRKK